VKGKLRAYLELVRLPNLFTAAADIVAAYFYSHGAWSWTLDATLLVAASICLYAGGVALNDVCDVRRDALERQRRPIPSGRLSRREAGAVASILLGLGVVLAFAASAFSGIVATALVVAIALYDGVLKVTFLAPAMMGLCRALNWLLGASLVPISLDLASTLPVLVIWVYVTSLTLFARREAGKSDVRWLAVAMVGVLAAVLGAAGLVLVLPNRDSGAWIAAGALMTLLLRRGGIAMKRPQPEFVQRAVKSFVVSLIFLDAVMVWSALGSGPALFVASFAVPTFLLARAFRVT